MNHFVKNLGIPMEMADAVALLKARPVRSVDAGDLRVQFPCG
jgi:diacylglycerol kinase family enzyme